MAAYLLGIDIGSTTIKANLFDYQGRLVSSGESNTILSRQELGNNSFYAFRDPDKI